MRIHEKANIVGSISTIAHPVGIRMRVKNEIKRACEISLTKAPKRVLVLGASGGYGFASWLISVFGANAETLGVFLEKEGLPGETATTGWYNVAMLERIAKEQGHKIRAINADVFSLRTKRQVAEVIRRAFGKVDCVIYSVAAPRRLDPETNLVHRSVLKPIDKSFVTKDINIETGLLKTITIPSATEEEINNTIKVMGGEDWYAWIDFLLNEELLEKGCKTFAYSYIGSEITAPIYRNGTIGRAKEHLEQTSELINELLQKTVSGNAFTAVTRSIVTQASAAIPSLTLYLSCLFRVAKETGTYEDCLDQVARLFHQIYGNEDAIFDNHRRLRLDNKELDSKIQKEVKRLIKTITNQTIDISSDYTGYRRNFLQLYGFEIPGVDYDASVETSIDISTDDTYQISSISAEKSFVGDPEKLPSENTSNIVVVGIGCQFAGAKNPRELWTNSLCKNQQFRDMPPSRFSCDDYFDPNPNTPDKTYSKRAALIDGFNFDWRKRRITKETYESTDPVQWLALETAEAALEDAALDWKNINRDRVGVFVSSTLGEFTRASNEMRPRWSYVQSAFLQAARDADFDLDPLLPLVEAFEHYYKVNLPAITKDSVAGELANVVAGRISNYFDFHGGAYVIDAACASSLLAIISATKALKAGEIDIAIAGGVDITLGTAMMVGFAKAGVFAKERMRVFDEKAEGFVPGEGAGFVVLRRKDEADISRDKKYAEILGHGISTDGKGGIATPNVKGQLLALKRAYRMSKISPLQLDFIEAHGTGTGVGDEVEVEAITELLSEHSDTKNRVLPEKKHIALSSVKSTIGHTKGAAGVAGFIEAVIGLNQRIIPPVAGCVNPNKVFKKKDCHVFPAMHTIKKTVNSHMTAGVSSMGFGGINTHVVLASSGPKYQHLETNSVKKIVHDGADQAAELFVFSAPNIDELLLQLENILKEVAYISYGELVDFSYELISHIRNEHTVKASLIAASPSELTEKISMLISQLKQKTIKAGECYNDFLAKIYVSVQPVKQQIGFVFPGQGSQQLNPCVRIIERYSWAHAIAEEVIAYFFTDKKEQELAWKQLFVLKEQAKDEEVLAKWKKAIITPKMSSCAIAISWLIWHDFLIRLGICPNSYLGHSYGDYMTLYAAGVYTREDLLKLISFRSELIQKYGNDNGGMVSLQCDLETANKLLHKITGIITIANINAPDQIIFSGEAESIKMVEQEASLLGIKSKVLPVATAFHSPLLEGARKEMKKNFPIANTIFNPDKDKKVILSITGQIQKSSLEIQDYFANHFISGVQFTSAVNAFVKEIDLAIEVGSGRIVSGLLTANGVKIHSFMTEKQSGDSSLEDLLAFLHTSSIEINWDIMFTGRYHSTYIPSTKKKFLESPFSKVKSSSLGTRSSYAYKSNNEEKSRSIKVDKNNCFDILVERIAELSGFESTSIKSEYKLLHDLGFDSILIARLSTSIASDLGIEANEVDALQFQDKTIAEIASYLESIENINLSSQKTPEKLNQQKRPHLVRNYIMTPHMQTLVLNKSLDVSKLGEVLLLEPNRINLNFNFSIKRRWCPSTPNEMKIALSEDCTKTKLIVILHQDSEADLISQLWMATQFVEKVESISFIVLGNLPLPNGFVKSISLEYPNLKLRILRFTKDTAANQIACYLVNELAIDDNVVVAEHFETGEISSNGVGFESNTRHVWYPKVVSPIGDKPRKQQIKNGDVILVTGGGKGITAECVLKLSAKTGGTFILLGRSQSPDTKVMSRFAELGVQAFYYSCDVQNLEALENTIRLAEDQFGLITAVIHGAGINQPRRTINITLEEAKSEISPKLEGMRNLCNIFDKKKLRFFVIFSSVSAVTGLPGNAWYSLSNELIEDQLKRYQATHKKTEVLALCYGVWDEVGMGISTGALSKLGSMGIGSLSVEEGTTRFVNAVITHQPATSLIITPSLGKLATWKSNLSTSSITGRFLEHIHSLETGVYGLCGSNLSLNKDLYLNDHRFGKNVLFPAVFGLEAMAEVAALVLNTREMPQRFTNISLNRAIIVDDNKNQEIRIAVVVNEPDNSETRAVKAEIFSEDDDFKEPCFEAEIHFELASKPTLLLPLKPSTALRFSDSGIYQRDGVFFHGDFYRRINKVYKLDLENLKFLVGIDSKPSEIWLNDCFAKDVSHPLLLGDVAVIDAMLQTSGFFTAPKAGLPIAIDSLVFNQKISPGLIYAQGNIHRNDNTVHSNMILRTFDGEVICEMINYQSHLLNIAPNNLSTEDFFTADSCFHPKQDEEESILDRNNIIKRLKTTYVKPFSEILKKLWNKIKQLTLSGSCNIGELLVWTWFFAICRGKINLHKELPKGAFIMAANHVSYADWLILYSVISLVYKRKIYFLAKERLFKNFLWAALMKYSKAICVEKNGLGDKAVEEIDRVLRETKHIIGIFPEGKRSRNGKLDKGYDGVAKIALSNNVPVVPVGIKGFYEMWPWHRKFPRIHKMEINIGEEILFSKKDHDNLSAVTKQIMLRIAELTDQEYNFKH